MCTFKHLNNGNDCDNYKTIQLIQLKKQYITKNYYNLVQIVSATKLKMPPMAVVNQKGRLSWVRVKRAIVRDLSSIEI